VVPLLPSKTLGETNFHVECIKTLKNSYKTKERTLHALPKEAEAERPPRAHNIDTNNHKGRSGGDVHV